MHRVVCCVCCRRVTGVSTGGCSLIVLHTYQGGEGRGQRLVGILQDKGEPNTTSQCPDMLYCPEELQHAATVCQHKSLATGCDRKGCYACSCSTS